MAYCAYGVLTPYRGTPLYEQLVEEGRLLADRGLAFYNGYNVNDFSTKADESGRFTAGAPGVMAAGVLTGARTQTYCQGDTLPASGCVADVDGDEWFLRLEKVARQHTAGDGVG